MRLLKAIRPQDKDLAGVPVARFDSCKIESPS
jgi:hypothetical protein